MVTLTYQERFKTMKGVFDGFTNRNLFELQSKGIFDELVSPLEVGKESNVFIAVKDGKKVIVKIYLVQNCNFNKMYDYIRKDKRYEYLKKRKREIIFSWVQREYKNLKKAEKMIVNTPKALGWQMNILVEEFIGKENPAPQLKDLHPNYPFQFFEDTITQIKRLYEGGLIHGDLSSFNILNHEDKPYLIDFSQATLIKTPNAVELLERDIINVLSFFKKLGVKAEVEEVMRKVMGKDYKEN